MLYDAYQRGPFKVPGFYDPSEKRLIGIILRPDTWLANTVYQKPDDDNYDIVLPTTFTGLYHKVKKPGKSGATEPTWATEAGEETTDGTVVWEAVNYNLMPVTETIASVAYTCTNGVTVSSSSNTLISCQCMVDALPAAAIAAGSFEVTAHIVKSNSEEIDVTREIRVGSR